MGARVQDMKQFVGLRIQSSNWDSVTRYGGLTLVGMGIYAALAPGAADPVWGAFLVAVGLTSIRVTAPTALILLMTTLGWSSLINALFGRFSIAGLLFIATAITLIAFQTSYRQSERPLAAAPGLAFGSLGLSLSGAITLVLAFGGSLVAFFTGWQYDAHLADILAAAGVHQAVLALAFGLGAVLQRNKTVWAALLGVAMAVVAVSSYLSLLLIAQG